MSLLIPRPDLGIADEELLAAQAIARTTGALSVELIDSYIAKLGELRTIVAAGGITPICPELTNANPFAPHTVILEAQAWLLAQIGYRINQIPDQNLVEFARLFGIELRAATKATTVLRFTVQTPSGSTVIVPAGTRTATADGTLIFETTAQLVISANTANGSVTARNVAAGHVLLAPSKLTNLLDGVANISAVTNLSAIDAGTEIETVESALERMKSFQRRGERLVSAEDLEDAILHEVLSGNGIVRAFSFISGDFYGERQVGHTSVIVSTSNGFPVDAPTRQQISALLEQAVGSQFIYLVDPVFIDFNVTATIKTTNVLQQSAVVVAIERNLRAFYDASRENFARPILRSEIIAVIEGTGGVDRIVTGLNEPILAAPLADQKLNVWQLPRLQNVNINVA